MDNWSKVLLASPEWRIAMALAIGLLIGMERERRKGSGQARAPAGLRTFTVVALLGGLATQTGSMPLIVLTGSFVAAAALLIYWLGDRRDPGFTTEVALLVTFVLGVVAQSQPVLALATGVVVTVLLAARTPLHHLVRDVLSEQELHDGLTFFIAAAVVLPILPDRAIGPFGGLNPFVLWRLAVVVMGLSAAGYGAVRVLGPRYGLFLAGFASGFVSSTAAIAAMGSRARNDRLLGVTGALGAVASIMGSLLYLLVLVIAADPLLVQRVAIPVGCAMAALAVYCLAIMRLTKSAADPPIAAGRAFDFRTILVFALLVGVFAALSTFLMAWLGSTGLFAGAIATGLADAHAAAVSIATLVGAGKADAATGARAILLALSANMAAKIPAAFALGPLSFSVRVALGLAILLVALWCGNYWNPLG